MKRSVFLRNTSLALLGVQTSAIAGSKILQPQPAQSPVVPGYLKNYAKEYAANPRNAAKAWFRDAGFGMFMHYGLYSLLGRHEWVMFNEKIHVAEYEKLAKDFKADKFDPDFITDLALEAGMKYINITTRHHDSFCLFDTKYSAFKSINTPAKKDLVASLAEQCHKKDLGMFFYYSHGRDWRHPHAANNDEWGGSARPEYSTPEPAYAYGDKHDLNIYLEFVKNQVRELLTHYGPVAGIWLDGISTPKSRPEKINLFKASELYELIWSLQPQVLISYKQGLLGNEDFKAPEMKWEQNDKKELLEICNTLQPNGWGYVKTDDGHHRTTADVKKLLLTAGEKHANLLLNTGPLPNGSIHPEDVQSLKGLRKA